MAKAPKKQKLKLKIIRPSAAVVHYSRFPREYIEGPQPPLLSRKETNTLEIWGLSPFAFEEITLLKRRYKQKPEQWMTLERWTAFNKSQRDELLAAMGNFQAGKTWLKALEWELPYEPSSTSAMPATAPDLEIQTPSSSENSGAKRRDMPPPARIIPSLDTGRRNAPDMGKPVPHTPEYESAMLARLGTGDQNLNTPETRTAAAVSYTTNTIATPPTITAPAAPDPVIPLAAVAAPAPTLSAVSVAASAPVAAVIAVAAPVVAVPAPAPAPDNDTEFTVKIKKARKKVPKPELTPTEPDIEIVARTISARQKLPTPDGSQSPDVTAVAVIQIKRDSSVKAWVLQNAAGVCESCNSSAPFRGADGLPYLEVHHVHQLGSSGSDTVSNTVALCPNCHREIHFGEKRKEIVSRLYETVSRLIQE